MIRAALLIAGFLSLGQCGKDETLTGYGAAGVEWKLTLLDGTPFSAEAILRFPEEGKLAGKAPCNTFSGVQSVPYPWFKAEEVAATRLACPEMAEEVSFLTALSEMTLAEVAGDTMILSNDQGREMVFRAQAVAE